MHQVLVTLSGIVVGCTLIIMFYTAVRTQWPSNYASATNDYGMIINRTIFRYVAFALAPTYFISLIVGTTVARAGGSGLIVATSIGLFHACAMYGVHIFRTLRYDRSGTRHPTLVLDVSLIIGVLSVAMIAGLGPGPLAFLVPPIDEFFKSLWTTVFVAILGVIVIAKTRVSVDVVRLVEKSRRELGRELIIFAKQQALTYGADPDLVEAILLTENLQRPRWFRFLERVKGKFFPAGSYGVMQVSASKPLSDEESITLAITQYLAGTALKVTEYGSFDSDQARSMLARYNDNPNFVQVALDVLWVTWDQNHPYQPPSPEVRAIEEGPQVEAIEAEKYESTLSIPKERLDLLTQVLQSMLLANSLLLTAPDPELRQLKASLDVFISSMPSRSAVTARSE